MAAEDNINLPELSVVIIEETRISQCLNILKMQNIVGKIRSGLILIDKKNDREIKTL